MARGVEDARPLGWWRSSSVCLELFDNGDFELSMRGRGPKVLVMGRVEEVESAGEEQTLRLAVKRVWRTRWSTPCHKVHEFGKWADEEEILGHTFSPDSVASVTVERLGDDGLRLCAERCIELKKETPRLGGRWRRPEGSNTELVELVLYEGTQWFVVSNGSNQHRVQSHAETKFVGPDAFEITFTPVKIPNVRPPDGLAQDTRPRRFRTRRLADQRLEACDEAGHCATLERQFDSNRTTFR